MTRSRQTADWGSRAGLAKIIPSSVTVGSGTGSADSTGKVTFSGVSSVSLNDVFSETYDNYLIQLDCDSGSTSASSFLRLRVSGADNSSNNYYWSLAFVPFSGTATINGSNGAGLTSRFAVGYVNGSEGGSAIINLFQPFRTAKTYFSRNLGGNYNNDNTLAGGGNMSVTTSYTGFTIFPDSGTITGRVSVYGFN